MLSMWQPYSPHVAVKDIWAYENPAEYSIGMKCEDTTHTTHRTMLVFLPVLWCSTHKAASSSPRRRISVERAEAVRRRGVGVHSDNNYSGEHSIHKSQQTKAVTMFSWKSSPGPLGKLYQSSSNGLKSVMRIDEIAGLKKRHTAATR